MTKPFLAAVHASVLAAAALCLPAPAAAGGFTWTPLREFQPNVPEGGRANTIAPSPDDPQKVAVASESGGVFLSTDRGVHWKHLDGLPVYEMVSVSWVPGAPSVLLATSLADFRKANGGGIWRSTDSGATWTHIFGPNEARANDKAQFGAGEIALAPGAPGAQAIYAITSSGIAQSLNQGASWAFCKASFSTAYPLDDSIVALANHILVVLGGDTAAHSTVSRLFNCNGDDGWRSNGSGISPQVANHDHNAHGLSGTAGLPYQVFFANAGDQLWASEDAGSTWTAINAPPRLRDNCGGMPFARLRQAPPG